MNQITQMPNDLNIFLENLSYQNYHRHSSYSNVSTPDCGTTNKEYAARVKELGHTILSSCEHGFQGNYWETYLLCEQYGLKFIFGAEAYWVKDRFEKDRSNNHICIFAKNENGRRAINKVLSEANETGYYYKPRLDEELILSLPSDDVFITTACVGFWNYDMKYSIEFIKKLNNKFKENFVLEVQYHNTDSQKSLNEKILLISKKLGINIIMGCDSHYLLDSQSYDREYILEYKGIRYESEDGWYMDYPDSLTAFNRFKEQGVLGELDILNAINNTNIFLEFEEITLDKNIKLPSIYEGLTQDEKNKIYKNIIAKEFKEYAKRYNITGKELKRYQEGIKSEVKCVIDTGMADYFLLDYDLIKRGKEQGGIVTKSGRGSAVSFFTNTLLGFSNVDRFIAPVHLYPERFMSTTRILETKSVPDIDMNLGNVEVFAQVQNDMLGDGHSYPMIAYGTLKTKSAWKMYSGANEDKIDFDTSNEISKKIEEYEEALKYAEEDEKDTVSVYDYIPEQYHSLYDESIKYQGIIMDKKKHPCGYVIYSGNIREEIGLIKCKSESGSNKKEYMVALIDGKSADKFKYLKNDLLKVDVCLLHKLTADRAEIEELTVRDLLEKSKSDTKVWDIYAKGYTLGVNQCEKQSTTRKVMKYLPKNDGELACFIAAIRPSFKSMFSTFSNREKFEYGIPAFDRIVQTETIKDSFIFFQEQIMAALAFSGIPMELCYDIIKAISKKNKVLIESYKEQFFKGFVERIMHEDKVSHEIAMDNTEKVWTIILDASQYGFNASHAYCMACDSLMDAYYKAHYPYEFYEVRLNVFSEKGKKDKVAAYKKEMDVAFGIKEGELKFRLDNRKFTLDKENKCIHPSLQSVKGIGLEDARQLYELRNNKYNSFIELYNDLVENTSINKGKIEILIKLDYFIEFGKSGRLLKLAEIYNALYGKKIIKKTDLGKYNLTDDIMKRYSLKSTEKQYREINIDGIIEELSLNVKDVDIQIKDKISHEIDCIGYAKSTVSSLSHDMYYVLEIKEYKNKKSITYYPEMYNIKTGEILRFKIKDFVLFAENKIKIKDVVRILSKENEPKKKNIDGKWKVVPNEFNVIINEWELY